MSFADKSQALNELANLLPEPFPQEKSKIEYIYEANNPLCGDSIRFSGKLHLEHLESESCIICRATAGLLWRDRDQFENAWKSESEQKTRDRLKDLLEFPEASISFLSQSKIGDWQRLIEIIREIPARWKCFLLPWKGFDAYTQKRGEDVNN